MELSSLSSRFSVRRLEPADVDILYALSCGNRIFYRYHPPFVTKESILDDMTALPPGKTAEDKYYIGFFAQDTLIAVMDLITGYPTEKTAFIGLFMTDIKYQSKGIGSAIITEAAAYLRTQHFEKIRLGVDKGNPQSYGFWQKNGFVPVREDTYILMERTL